MVDDIASAIEQEMVEEKAVMCPKPSAKRQRKRFPDAREESDKERVDDSLLQEARRIKENNIVNMNATDRNVRAKWKKQYLWLSRKSRRKVKPYKDDFQNLIPLWSFHALENNRNWSIP
ncbi:unnamed protein product [Nezara viridula]|uniref:Uncharacterized protein n=1 Tax=Nezara viridula TaxID=85310 RepID=A0A9P0E8E5_NEZVI|nr:unnamed protein product [Nezara viridula]